MLGLSVYERMGLLTNGGPVVSGDGAKTRRSPEVAIRSGRSGMKKSHASRTATAAVLMALLTLSGLAAPALASAASASPSVSHITNVCPHPPICVGGCRVCL